MGESNDVNSGGQPESSFDSFVRKHLPQEVADFIIDLKNEILGNTREDLGNLRKEVDAGVDSASEMIHSALFETNDPSKIGVLSDSTGGAWERAGKKIGGFFGVDTWGGKTAAWVYKEGKFKEFLNKAKGKCESAIVNFGINDCAGIVRTLEIAGESEIPAEKFSKIDGMIDNSIAYLEKMGDELVLNGVQPSLATIFPLHSKKWGGNLDKVIQRYNQKVINLAKEKGWALVDLRHGMSDLSYSQMTKDGVHLREDNALSLMASSIEKAVNHTA